MVGGKTTGTATSSLIVVYWFNVCLPQAISLRTGNRGEVPASYLSRKASSVCVLGAVPDVTRQGSLQASADDRDPMEERLRVYSW